MKQSNKKQIQATIKYAKNEIKEWTKLVKDLEKYLKENR